MQNRESAILCRISPSDPSWTYLRSDAPTAASWVHICNYSNVCHPHRDGKRRLGTPTRAMLRRLATARSLRVAAASAAASAAGTLAYTSCDASSWSPASYPLALAPPVVASKPGRLQGRSAIVTGAASGMGAASAKLFAADGRAHHVVVVLKPSFFTIAVSSFCS